MLYFCPSIAKSGMKKRKSNRNKNHRPELVRFIEYFVSGGAWFWSGYILIILLDDVIGLFLANFVGNAVGITINFLLARYWVFKSKRPSTLMIAAKRYVIYTALNAFLLNYLILLGLKDIGIGVEIGQFIASGFFTVWNYVWYKVWVFKDMDKKPRRTRHHA